MDIVAAYGEVGTFRGAAEMCGTCHKTVRRVLERHAAGVARPELPARRRNYEDVREVVVKRVASTRGRITAKRLLPEARAAGYTGSARNFRRLVSECKREWRRQQHGRRPAVWAPGETLIIDWGTEAGLHVFCAVSAWSRFRFVRFAAEEGQATTLRLLAECLETLGGVPKVVLSDRMGCLKGGVVAGVVVPAPAYVRFATHYGFRPDFCEAADPESKGMVERLVGYAKSDLVVPQGLVASDLVSANRAAAAWCDEVNRVVHSEIAAVPADRLEVERPLLRLLPGLRPQIGQVVVRKVDKLSCVRFGSGRYSVPNRLIGRQVRLLAGDGRLKILDGDEIVADHPLVAPGEASVVDDHYGGPRAARRPVRPQTAAERAFCALGPVAEAFIKGAAAAGVTKLSGELAEIVALESAHGREVLLAALERAVTFRRWRAADVRSILAAGAGAPQLTAAGEALVYPFPAVPTRSLDDYRAGELG